MIFISAKALGITAFWVSGAVMIAGLGNRNILRKVMQEAIYMIAK